MLPLTRITPTAETRWNILPASATESSAIAGSYGLHPVVARILAARGWIMGSTGLGEFMAPVLKLLRSPFELGGMEAAVERTTRAIANREKICIFGDYDVDGVTSTALLWGTLRKLGVTARVVIPHRIQDGYGMNVARVEEIARDGITLILTVDTGVTAVEPIRRARELGVDVVVTDHHLAGDALPEAAAMVNPNNADDYYEHGRLCGVGVAFKFAHALLKRSDLPEAESRRFLMDQLDLVALGTIADVVPLLAENRVLARHGLDALVATKRPGLRALIEIAGLAGRPATAEFVGFGLGPRLNAAGRTDDARLAFDLLTTTDPAEATRLAKHLDHLNRERRTIEDEILTASIDEAETIMTGEACHALVVGGEGWHLGVVGIVASRLTERYAVPAIVLAIDNGLAKGSARSVPGFDIHEALSACGSCLVAFGGHAAAAGLRLEVSSLPRFRRELNEHAGGVFSRLDRTRTIDVDAEVNSGDVTWELLNDIRRLEPFGSQNPPPLFLMRGVRAAAPPRIVGRNHLRMKLGQGDRSFNSIGFSLGHLKPAFEGGEMDILFRPKENEFNGTRSLELELVDGRPSR